MGCFWIVLLYKKLYWVFYEYNILVSNVRMEAVERGKLKYKVSKRREVKVMAGEGGS